MVFVDILYDEKPSFIHMMSKFRHKNHAFLIWIKMFLDDGRHIG